MTILDIPRWYTGLAEWLACLVFALQFRPKITGIRFYAAILGALVVQCLFLELTDDISLLLWVPCMIAAAGLMLVFFMVLCDADTLVLAYTNVRAFILAEFAAALQWQIHCFLWGADQVIWWQRYGLLVLVYSGVFGFMFLLEKRSGHVPLSVTIHEWSTMFLIGVCVFAISNLSFYFRDTPFSGQYAGEIMNLRTFADLGGVAILYAYHLQRCQELARKELGAMQTMLENQYAQYRMSRDSIDLVNRKYHDLKHQLALIRSADESTRNQWLDELEAEIHAYEVQNKTGNAVLDTLLTSKGLYCQKHGIELAVVADGKLLSFLDVMDICTIFGNALDNAIECELKIPDKSQRMIRLSLSSQRQFLLLQVENYCPEPPRLQNGFPVTTKSDPEHHGIGLKSIRHTAAKYGGTTTITCQHNWFVLKVLMPLP